jgi:DNA-binding LytR/AlgR family response regulator
MQVLIIEDEPFAQQELIRLLNILPQEIQVLECLDSVEESVAYLEAGNQEPDLIFMDIQLSDGLSFEIFERTEVKPPVIFTTAYDEYAIKAFKVNSIDYLLKPIEEEDLVNALGKYHSWKKETTVQQSFFTNDQLQQVLALYKPAYKSRLVVKLGDRIRHVETNEVAYFYSEDKVTFIRTNKGERFIVNHTLEQLEKVLDPLDFYRLNRKYIAHIRAIETIDKYFNSRLKIGLTPEVDDEVLISRTKVSDFLNWLER